MYGEVKSQIYPSSGAIPAGLRQKTIHKHQVINPMSLNECTSLNKTLLKKYKSALWYLKSLFSKITIWPFRYRK